MKFIIAIIQPHSLDPVRAALSSVDVQGMTVTEVRGYGRQKGHTEIELAVGDDVADRTIEIIRDTARSGKIGDGKIFVLDLKDAVRIRTGESGEDAL
jgi:nitrogen regulatory protein P-II 2